MARRFGVIVVLIACDVNPLWQEKGDITVLVTDMVTRPG